MSKSNKTKAEDAVKAAVDSAQLFAVADESEAPKVLQAGEAAYAAAVAATEKAGTSDDHATSLATVRELLGLLTEEEKAAADKLEEEKAAADKIGEEKAIAREADARVARERAAEAEAAAAKLAAEPVIDYHMVAPGCAITTLRRGVQGPGARIDAKDLGLGEADLAKHVETGYLVAPVKK